MDEQDMLFVEPVSVGAQHGRAGDGVDHTATRGLADGRTLSGVHVGKRAARTTV